MSEKVAVPVASQVALSPAALELEEKIKSKKLRPAVVGLGYVGLPLLKEFAAAGFQPIGIDLSCEKIEQLMQGASYVADVPAGEIAPAIKRGQVTVTTDFSALDDADTIDICVPTPLRKTRDPDVSYIVAATEEIVKHLHKGQMVILESTTYPGTTVELVLPMLAETGMKVGEDFFLAFSPERVDPGNPTYNTKNIPKIVGGVTPACTYLATRLFSSVMESVVPVKSTNVAEMVKLLENTFRSVNIGLVNEIALLCDRMKIDVWEVIDAAATKPFGFMPFYPGPGLGGHCIPIDPFYLSWKAKLAGLDAKFIELAGQINASMPNHVAGKVVKALNSKKKAVNGSRVLVLGVAYKADIDDMRESPALDIIRLLREDGAEIAYHDPFVEKFDFEGTTYTSSELNAETFGACDVAVIVTAHKGIDYANVVAQSSLVVDTRNALAGMDNDKISRI